MFTVLLILIVNKESECSTTSSTPKVEEVNPAKRLKGFAAVLQHIAEENDDVRTYWNTFNSPTETEITSYLEYPSLEPDANPLEWWKLENGRFPNLAYLAKKYLCICGTSIPSERIFSKTSHIANNLRNCLTPENVNKPVFLSCYLTVL